LESTLSITIANELAEIPRAQRLAEKFGAAHGISPEVTQAVSLALEEVVSNVIKYGYDGSERHSIDLLLSACGSGLTLRVADTGRPFNPLERPEVDTCIPLEERAVGGLGIHLIKSMMDEVQYTRQGNRNVLVLTKRP